MTEQRSDDALARKRYFAIALTRLVGAILLIVAMVTLRGMTAGSEALGYALLLAGVVFMLVLPQIMVRRWRSSKDDGSKDDGPMNDGAE
ncbi:MAG: hypothetical protein WA908_02400 [Pontixanthobacter sp.]